MRPKKVLWLLPYTVGSRGSPSAVSSAKRYLGMWLFSGWCSYLSDKVGAASKLLGKGAPSRKRGALRVRASLR